MFLDVTSVSHYHSSLHWPGKHTCVWQAAIREYNLLLDSGSGDLCGKKREIVFLMLRSVEKPDPCPSSGNTGLRYWG